MNFWSSVHSKRSARPTFTNGIRLCQTQPYRVEVETARKMAASFTVISLVSCRDCICVFLFCGIAEISFCRKNRFERRHRQGGEARGPSGRRPEPQRTQI